MDTLQTKKAPGPDTIPAEVLKAVVQTHLQLLLHMINICTNLETKQMQVTTVCIQTKPVNIIVAAIYCPPWFKMEKDDFIWLFEKN